MGAKNHHLNSVSFSFSVHEFAGTYPIDFGRVVRLFDCKTNRSRFLRYAEKKKNEMH